MVLIFYCFPTNVFVLSISGYELKDSWSVQEHVSEFVCINLPLTLNEDIQGNRYFPYIVNGDRNKFINNFEKNFIYQYIFYHFKIH